MANRYWVGGAGTWSSGNTANWSDTSGGAGGFSVPGSADVVTFDTNSGSGTVTFTNGGVTVSSALFNAASITVSLGAAFSATNDLSIAAGTFTTNNYAVTVATFGSNGSSAGTINLGSSTVTINGVAFGLTFFFTAPTFNAGTSQINLTGVAQTINASSVTFYNVAFTSTALTAPKIEGANTFNNLSVTGRTSAGVASLSITGNQTINGTLTLSAGTDATMRTFVRSNTIGTTVTLTCAAVAATDIDFRDITIAGAAAPVSGTRLGDCKGNSGITFGAGVNKYWNLAGNNSWSATAWATSAGGVVAVNNFPLAQDTAIFTSTSPATGATTTVNAAYNIGTLDMSARTANTMTLATGTQTPAIYGNWTNGTGITLTGTGTLTFAGRGSQTITSAGRTFTQGFTIDSPAGSVTLQDAFATNRSASTALTVTRGTFDAAGYAVTLSGASAGVSSSDTSTRTIAIGAGTWTIAGTGTAWGASTSTNLTVTGTGTISLTSASTKVFAGGGIKTYPTLNQGGSGTLTVTGSNKFANLTSTTIAGILFTGGTVNEFTAFSINGASGNLLQLSSTNTTQAILKKPTAWNVGANSTNSGNNTGLSFTAGGNDYLNVSYIIGRSAGGNFLIFF